MDEFGQKAKQSLKLGLGFLQKKTQQAIDITKLQGQLKSTQEQRKQALVTLGEKVCAMFDMDRVEAEQVKDDVHAIRDLSSTIASLEKQLLDARQGHEAPAADPERQPEEPHESESSVHPET